MLDEEQILELVKDFTVAVNKASADVTANMADFILAHYLVMCLQSLIGAKTGQAMLEDGEDAELIVRHMG